MVEEPIGEVIPLWRHTGYRSDAVGKAQMRVAQARAALDLAPAEFAVHLSVLIGWQPDPETVEAWETTIIPPGDVIEVLSGHRQRWEGRFVSGADDARVQRGQDEWVATRAALNANRSELARAAASVYDPAVRLGDTGLLAPADWLPPTPVPLDRIRAVRGDRAAPAVDGTEAQTAPVRPPESLLRLYHRYSSGIRALAHPRLFANKPTWWPLSVDVAAGALTFCDGTYFVGVDVCEALAHEFALLHLDADGQPSPDALAVRDLPFRRLVGDPFDVASRNGLCAVDTLTIRVDGDGARFLLHRRDSRSVAVAGGTFSVIPCGIFQPSSMHTAARVADFDLWRNVMREMSEELLGNPEHDGDGKLVDYDAEPFAGFESARSAGTLRPYLLGVGLDALTLVCEILTVVVVEGPVFDQLFRHMVDLNEEGEIVGPAGEVWLPFTEGTIADLRRSGRLSPATAACLELAWKHRAALIAADLAAAGHEVVVTSRHPAAGRAVPPMTRRPS